MALAEAMALAVALLSLSEQPGAAECLILVSKLLQDIVVKRIDEGLGLVLEVPSEPTASPGFVHISNTADTKVDKLQQVRRCHKVSTFNSVRTAVD